MSNFSSDEEPKMSSLLDPEHPLLENFQKVLKEHLALQIENLKSEIHELVRSTKGCLTNLILFIIKGGRK